MVHKTRHKLGKLKRKKKFKKERQLRGFVRKYWIWWNSRRISAAIWRKSCWQNKRYIWFNLICHILRRNCLLQLVIEGKVKGRIEVTRRGGRRRRKLLGDLKERRGYCHLKEEALDRTVWRAGLGRGFGPVVRQTNKWMNIHEIWTHFGHGIVQCAPTFTSIQDLFHPNSWQTPVAAVTVYSAPDDGRKGRPKHVEHTCSC